MTKCSTPWRTTQENRLALETGNRQTLMSMTHDELIKHGAEWLLAKNCKVVITDMTHAGPETPDCLGWQGNKRSILLEAKASRSDFHRDRRKSFRHPLAKGLGCVRYYIAPQGLLKSGEMPRGWGLLEVAEPRGRQRKHRVILSHGNQPSWTVGEFLHTPDRDQETGLLLSALRRVGQTCPKGFSVQAYTHETQNRATLGVVPVTTDKNENE